MRPRQRDDGAVLILTLVLTVILAVVVLALASYATTGLATSDVTNERSESNSVTSAGLAWFIEELSKKQIGPEEITDCDAVGVVETVPDEVLPPYGAGVDVSCRLLSEAIDFHPTVELVAIGQTNDGTVRTITAVVQVPRNEYTAQVYSWTAE